MFITQSSLLATKVRSYYDEVYHTLCMADLSDEKAERLRALRPALNLREDFEDIEDESAGLRGLPSRFSDLTDEHFPLFLSHQNLLLLLENPRGIRWGEQKKTAGYKQAFKRFEIGSGVDISTQLGIQVEIDEIEDDEDEEGSSVSRLWAHFVDADVFGEWFKTFDQRLTKVRRSFLLTQALTSHSDLTGFKMQGIEPALCWSEILGTICGSEASCETEKGYLSRETYLALSERTHSTYASHRDKIYSIFEAYVKLKHQNHAFVTALIGTVPPSRVSLLN